MKRTSRSIYVFIFCTSLAMGGCKSYLDLPLPLNTIAGSGAFTTDKSCAAVLNDVYAQLISSGDNLFDGNGAGYRAGLYTDELMSVGTATSSDRVFYQNAVQNANTGGMWTFIYKYIYATNLAIEGISGASDAAVKQRKQWLGEAYFMRALLHFYLTNLFGDAVIANTSDYTVVNALPRSPQAAVYAQIVKDLLEAQSLLSEDYTDNAGAVTTERARPNKACATALLARVYLHTKEWAKAEEQASLVIAQASRYSLPQPADAFLKESAETIFGLAPVAGSWVRDYNYYNNGMADTVPAFPASGVNVAMSNSLVAAFETGDKRFASWTRASTSRATMVTNRFPGKYKSRTTGTAFIVVLRLAEQYLIRAEARAQLNKLTGTGSAKEDLDAVRSRAGLTGTTATGSLTAMMDAIMNERRVELFAEQGYRLYDLRRTERLNAVMTPLVPQKGGVKWETFMRFWPINADDVFANPAIKQTEGYQ